MAASVRLGYGVAQQRAHIEAALKLGATPAQIPEVIRQMWFYRRRPGDQQRLRRTATIESPAGQALRNAVLRLVGHVPGARHAIAMRLSELSERAA